jgi:hypothetical protein
MAFFSTPLDPCAFVSSLIFQCHAHLSTISCVKRAKKPSTRKERYQVGRLSGWFLLNKKKNKTKKQNKIPPGRESIRARAKDSNLSHQCRNPLTLFSFVYGNFYCCGFPFCFLRRLVNCVKTNYSTPAGKYITWFFVFSSKGPLCYFFFLFRVLHSCGPRFIPHHTHTHDSCAWMNKSQKGSLFIPFFEYSKNEMHRKKKKKKTHQYEWMASASF